MAESDYRYPLANPCNWSSTIVIAILIDEDISSFVDPQDRTTIMWAIYYVQIFNITKQKLIKKYYDTGSFKAAL